MADINAIADQIQGLTLLEASQLRSRCWKKSWELHARLPLLRL